MTMADKIVVMHDGIVEQVGRPLDSTTARRTCSSRASSARRYELPRSTSESTGFRSAISRCPSGCARGLVGRRPSTESVPSTSVCPDSEGIPVQVVVTELPVGNASVWASRGPGGHVCIPGADCRQAREIIRIMPDVASMHLFDKEAGHKARRLRFLGACGHINALSLLAPSTY
jgi:multiple sugar transport system ATP-binding protein